jgi:hypothetical protein
MPHDTVLKPSREISLVRSSMRALAGAREGCADCRRTPLMGETVYFFGERMVCELCRPLRRGEPTRKQIVHSSEHELTVRRRAAA